MKKNMFKPAKSYTSNVLDEFLSLGSQAELARTENRMMLAVKIQEALTAKGIGKKQFAEMAGQKPSVVTKWLSGGHNFTVDTLTDIQRLLEIQLLALETEPAEHEYQINIRVSTPQPADTADIPEGSYVLSRPEKQRRRQAITHNNRFCFA